MRAYNMGCNKIKHLLELAAVFSEITAMKIQGMGSAATPAYECIGADRAAFHMVNSPQSPFGFVEVEEKFL